MKYCRSNTVRGFGLTELLVAIAIFLTIIGAISLVFSGSLRALRQAEQSQQIYEMVRGAMQVMERDLSNAFVAREYGDLYQFYGTPIGFTFIGVVKYQPDDQPNLARVTYVLRRDTGRLARRSEPAESDGIDNDGDDIVDEADEVGLINDVPLFSLIRFVELGRNNLESFPIDWTAAIVDDTNPGVAPDTVEDIIGDPAAPDLTYGNFVGNAVQNGLCRQDDTRCLEEVAKAGRRQVWIAMLAGLDSGWHTSTSTFPDYFELNGLDPEDYVLLENLSVADLATAFSDFELLDSAASNIAELPLSPAPSTEFSAVTYNGQFFEYTEWVAGRVEVDPGPPPEFESVVRPNTMGFWLDWRNVNQSNNGIDDDGDGFVDNVGLECDGGVPYDEADFCNGLITCPNVELPVDCTPHGGDIIYAPGPGPGSPLSARLPQQVDFRFRLFVEAPTVGAADFERNFSFELDIPAALTRVTTE